MCWIACQVVCTTSSLPHLHCPSSLWANSSFCLQVQHLRLFFWGGWSTGMKESVSSVTTSSFAGLGLLSKEISCSSLGLGFLFELVGNPASNPDSKAAVDVLVAVLFVLLALVEFCESFKYSSKILVKLYRPSHRS